VKVAELIRLLGQDGRQLARTKGSHRQFKNRRKPGTVTVAGKPRLDIPSGTLNAILKQAGLEKEGVDE
jgi:predicted RNA binding protein YcfA (HicA-like mRNA interferase family)